jgi:hypothetical protein
MRQQCVVLEDQSGGQVASENIPVRKTVLQCEAQGAVGETASSWRPCRSRIYWVQAQAPGRVQAGHLVRVGTEHEG